MGFRQFLGDKPGLGRLNLQMGLGRQTTLMEIKSVDRVLTVLGRQTKLRETKFADGV